MLPEVTSYSCTSIQYNIQSDTIQYFCVPIPVTIMIFLLIDRTQLQHFSSRSKLSLLNRGQNNDLQNAVDIFKADRVTTDEIETVRQKFLDIIYGDKRS